MVLRVFLGWGRIVGGVESWEDKLSRIFRVSFASNNRGIVASKGGEDIIRVV